MGNAFLQLFMRGGPAALKAVQGFGAKAVTRAAKPVIDTVTNPQTYRSLAAQAENVLQRGLPGQFAGANFGAIPTRFTGLISDVAGMPAGLQRSAQAGMVNRAIQEAAGAVPQLARGAQQYATGALKAPVIGDVIRTGQAVVTNPLQTAIQTGGQFARDPGLRREFLKQFGGTSEKAARALAGGGGINFGQVGSLMQNLAPGGATGLRGSMALPGALGGAAWGLADPRPMIEASNWLGDRLRDANLVYDPRKDPRVTSIQDRPVVNPGELAPDYSGARDRSFRFAQYQGMGQTPVGGTPPPAPGGGSPPPPAPTLPPPPGASSPGAQAGQQTPITSDVPAGGSFAGGPTYRGAGVSTGAGVPALRQNVQNRALSQEVLNAAQQYAAPAGVSLPSFYAGQQQLGRSMEQTGELQRQLKDLGGATGMTPEALMKWAQANPGLAYRELQRLQGRSQ
jgi:hypothetical protein